MLINFWRLCGVMSFAANLVYLEDERKNIISRIAKLRQFLKENPHASVYKRKISGQVYYYKKYRLGDNSVSQYLGNAKALAKDELAKIKQNNDRVQAARRQLALAKIELKAIERQLKIVHKVYEYDRATRVNQTAGRVLQHRHI
jgi:hypothetical protein